MSRTQREILVEARTHFEVLASHARGDLLDQLVVDAICMRLSAGIEVLNTLDPEVRGELFGDDWTVMWGCAIA